MSRQGSVPERDGKPLAIQSDENPSKEISPSRMTNPPLSAIVPPNHLLFPAYSKQLYSAPGHIAHLLVGVPYEVTLDQEVTPDGLLKSTNEPWLRPASDVTAEMHFECIFLRSDAFRIRLGLADYFPFKHPYPVDNEFPPPCLRPSIFPDNADVEVLAGSKREDLVCGLQLRAKSGNIWVNPRGSSFELTYTTDAFCIKGFYQAQPPPNEVYEEDNKPESGSMVHEDEHPMDSPPHQLPRAQEPFFQQASEGPFTPAMLPHGLLTLEGEVTLGTELLILQEGETLYSGGLGSHTAGDLTPKTTENESVGPRTPPPFIYTSRGWGILMRKPALIQAADLSDGRKLLSLTMYAERGMLDYIIVRGQALKACISEYV